jgi:hypothetical protein
MQQLGMPIELVGMVAGLFGVDVIATAYEDAHKK